MLSTEKRIRVAKSVTCSLIIEAMVVVSRERERVGCKLLSAVLSEFHLKSKTSTKSKQRCVNLGVVL